MIFEFLYDVIEIGPLLQVPEGTNQFFEWYFYGLGGLGGWLLFFMLALIAVIWLIYDNQKRRINAIGWKIGVVLLLLLLLPTMMYRFTVTPVDFGVYQLLKLYAPECPPGTVITDQFPEVNFLDCEQLRRSLPPMTPYGEIVFYLGLLGGVLAPVLAIGYYITFMGLVGCIQGHVYEKELGECPYCKQALPPIIIPSGGGGIPPGSDRPLKPRKPLPPTKPVVSFAWLVDSQNNRRYDLCEDSTLLGRGKDNDIMLADPAAGRQHARIRETNGHFTLYDLGSSNGTFLNGKKLRAPQVLQNGDLISLGDTNLKFVRA